MMSESLKKRKKCPRFGIGALLAFAVFHLVLGGIGVFLLAKIPHDSFSAAHASFLPCLIMLGLPLFVLLCGVLLLILDLAFAKRFNMPEGRMIRFVIFFFFLPFLAVGVCMGWMVFSDVRAVSARLEWARVPATVEASQIKSTRSANRSRPTSTQKAKARFSYTWEGKKYTSFSIDGRQASDNIGSYQHDVARRLKDARESKTPLRAYVDPENPRDAVLFNWVRPEIIGFFALFVLCFGGVGCIMGAGSLQREVNQLFTKTGDDAAPVRLNRLPTCFAAIAYGVLLTALFSFIVLTVRGFPPEAVYGGTVPLWFYLLPLPGIIMVCVALVTSRHDFFLRPMQCAYSKDPEPGAVDCLFTFPAAFGEVKPATLRLSASSRTSNTFPMKKLDETATPVYGGNGTCTLRACFRERLPLEESASDAELKLVLLLETAKGRKERYAYKVCRFDENGHLLEKGNHESHSL